MCLYVNPKKTAELLKQGPTIRAWKVLTREWHRGHHRLTSQIMHLVWNPGKNISNSRNRKPRKHAACVSRGIHVFLTRKEAASRFSRSHKRRSRIVPVTCHTKDLIAADQWGKAVFTKMHLSKQAYNKAIKPC